jgi:AAA ATPase-like protein
MITRISIENFKGIGDRIEVPIRPITLLCGANSAGKSSIMQAIHYAREVLERHNFDADKTLADDGGATRYGWPRPGTADVCGSVEPPDFPRCRALLRRHRPEAVSGESIRGRIVTYCVSVRYVVDFRIIRWGAVSSMSTHDTMLK